MERSNLKTLGLDRETIEQIMAREKFDIEKEKRKLKETEDVLEELKTKLSLEREVENLREAQAIYLDILKLAANS
ncbi:MAG: hypothetical protein MSA90_03980 [Faecalicatena sp.]|nr:hypothetical protein [Faecalicatena sp.]MCI6464607.1 hypothetical protein [Faecalicatena sp.]